MTSIDYYGIFIRRVNEIRFVTQQTKPGTLAEFLDAFLLEFFSVEHIENPHDEDGEYGPGWDEITIDINSHRKDNSQKYLKVHLHRYIKPFKHQDELQGSFVLLFDKSISSDSFSNRADFFAEKEEWLNTVNNNAVFQLIKNSVPTETIIDIHVDCIG